MATPMDLTAEIQRVEKLLTNKPPQAAEALKALEPILKASSVDPRANLYQAMALSLTGKKEQAVTHATLAATMSHHIFEEATSLLDALKKK